MTQEDKILLLKDLCSRLPYYPKCEMIDELRVVNNEKDSSYISILFPKHIELFSYHNNFTIKPYLRPMSSMTEEEKHKLLKFGAITCLKNGEVIDVSCVGFEIHADVQDYLNAHHFDYRGLIPKGLAIEVTKENNPYEN
jgi:hypothetical protein